MGTATRLRLANQTFARIASLNTLPRYPAISFDVLCRRFANLVPLRPKGRRQRAPDRRRRTTISLTNSISALESAMYMSCGMASGNARNPDSPASARKSIARAEPTVSTMPVSSVTVPRRSRDTRRVVWVERTHRIDVCAGAPGVVRPRADDSAIRCVDTSTVKWYSTSAPTIAPIYAFIAPISALDS